MEDILEKISNKLSFKETQSYEISGKIDSTGLLYQPLSIQQKFNSNATHYIYLVSVETSAFIPNVKKDYNDKFYCFIDGVEKTFILPAGGYEVKDYYRALGLDENKIKIDLCMNTGKSIITIADNCSVDFTNYQKARI